MTRTFFTAAIATLALSATAADAQTSARQRGNASGQEAKERMTTKELNTQQLAGIAATPSPSMPSSAMTPGSSDMPATAPSSPDMAAPGTGAMPAAPDAAAPGMSPSGMAPSSEAVPATDPATPVPPTPPEPR